MLVRRIWRVGRGPAAAVALALGVFSQTAGPGLAAPVGGGADTQAALSADGGTAVITGTVDCSGSGARPVLLRVILTQAATGALAEGFWQRTCSDPQQTWSLTLNAGGDHPLQSGQADVSVVDMTDALQWIDPTQLGPATSSGG